MPLSTSIYASLGALLLGGCGLFAGLDDFEDRTGAGGGGAGTGGSGGGGASGGGGSTASVTASSGSPTSTTGTGGGGASYDQLVLSLNPLAYYRFDEPSGDMTMVDAAGPSNGMYVPVFSKVPGLWGPATTGLNVDDDAMGRGGAMLASPLPLAFTIETWVNLDPNNTKTRTLVYTRTFDQGTYVWLYMEGGDLIVSSGVAMAPPRAPFRPINGTWHMVVVTRDGDDVDFYVDGVQVGSGPANGMAPTRQVEVAIAADPNGDFELDGAIDEVAIYGEALDPSVIMAHHDAGVAGL